MIMALIAAVRILDTRNQIEYMLIPEAEVRSRFPGTSGVALGLYLRQLVQLTNILENRLPIPSTGDNLSDPKVNLQMNTNDTKWHTVAHNSMGNRRF